VLAVCHNDARKAGACLVFHGIPNDDKGFDGHLAVRAFMGKLHLGLRMALDAAAVQSCCTNSASAHPCAVAIPIARGLIAVQPRIYSP
jgi:hypothetical protein